MLYALCSMLAPPALLNPCPVKSEAYFTGAKAIQLGPEPIHEDMKVKLEIT